MRYLNKLILFSARLPVHSIRVSAFGLIALACGCATPDGEVHIIQPQLEGWEADIQLLSEQVHWCEDQGLERVLAEFPLPGAMTGEPAYLLYVQYVPGRDENIADEAGPRTLRGFLIQTRGEHEGLTLVISGSAVVKGRSNSRGARRQFDLTLRCDDGTTLKGTLTARRDPWSVEDFEKRRRSGDVAALDAFELSMRDNP